MNLVNIFLTLNTYKKNVPLYFCYFLSAILTTYEESRIQFSKNFTQRNSFIDIKKKILEKQVDDSL